ncbi:regulator of cell morphogenesis and NO signaling [Labrenzia sp. MBR-25]
MLKDFLLQLPEADAMTTKTDRVPQNPAELTRFIEAHYHAKHRADLPFLVELAAKVEAVHNDQPDVPAGLAELLREMVGDLEVHMKNEELILFPAIRRSAEELDVPITAMREDHDDHAEQIEKIKNVTANLTLPEDACRSWTRLYTYLSAFICDLEDHIRIENDVLFPQFEKRVVLDV